MQIASSLRSVFRLGLRRGGREACDTTVNHNPTYSKTVNHYYYCHSIAGNMENKRRVFVVGVGMTKFEKPGRTQKDYPEMAEEAVQKAMKDANVSYNEVEQACVGYVYGDSTCGQRALYQMGMTGIPIFNVNNNCSTGSTALFLAKQLVEGNMANCVLALGFEKMERGSLSAKFMDRTNPMDKHLEVLMNNVGLEPAPVAAQLFGSAAKEHMKKYGSTPEQYIKIAYKNHAHSVNNPYSQFQNEVSIQDIEKSPVVYDFLTRLQCCPTSDGAAAAILASEEFVKEHRLESQAVEILGMEMATDLPSTFKENSCIKMVGYDMTKKAAEKLFTKLPYKPQDVDVVELHDCFSANELLTYEALGLCEEGRGGDLVDRGDNTYGGKYVVNPSGGLISKGHPLGATGLAQCSELCWQLRGQAAKRQVPDAELALQHNIGLGGAVVVALYKMGYPHLRGGNQVQYQMTSASSVNDFKCGPLFKMMGAVVDSDGPKFVNKIKAVYGFKVKNGPGGKEGYWVVDLKNGRGSVEFEGKTKPDVTFIMSDTDLWDMMNGQLNAQKAFFQGKLKMQGNMGLAMRLKDLQDEVAKYSKAKL